MWLERKLIEIIIVMYKVVMMRELYQLYKIRVKEIIINNKLKCNKLDLRSKLMEIMQLMLRQ